MRLRIVNVSGESPIKNKSFKKNICWNAIANVFQILDLCVCVRELWHRQTIFEYAKIAFTCISDAFQFV